MHRLSLTGIPLFLLLATPTSAWTTTTSTITAAAASRTCTRTKFDNMNALQPPTRCSHQAPLKTTITSMGADNSVERADTHAHNPLGSSITRADWLRAGAGLASMVPLVFAFGSRVDAATGGESVTVIGAGGKTGKECVKYLVARGTGKSCFKRVRHAFAGSKVGNCA